jgi:hypothetical protein
MYYFLAATILGWHLLVLRRLWVLLLLMLRLVLLLLQQQLQHQHLQQHMLVL